MLVPHNGPIKERRCTDFLFWLLFVVAFVAYGGTCAYSYKHNQRAEFFNPVDGDGQLCGLKENSEFPLLYYIVFKNGDLRAVCVKDCPVEKEDGFDCKKTSRIANVAVCKANNPDRYGYGTRRVLNRFCVPNTDKLPEHFEKQLNNVVGSFGLDDIQENLEDIDDAGWLFLYSFITCVIIALGYAYMIYYFTGMIVWTSILTCFFGLVFLSVWLTNHYE